MSETLKCQTIDCVVVEDTAIFELQPLPSITPTPRTVFVNEAVYFACVGTLTFTGTPPPWITVDTANNRLVGAAGLYIGTSQLTANANAQNVLDTYAASKIASGQFICSIGTLSLSFNYSTVLNGGTASFGNVPIGATGNSQDFSFQNTGAGQLQIASAVLTTGTDFTVTLTDPSDPPLTLQTNEVFTMKIKASKLTTGTVTDTLTIISNGTNTPFVITLSANFV